MLNTNAIESDEGIEGPDTASEKCDIKPNIATSNSPGPGGANVRSTPKKRDVQLCAGPLTDVFLDVPPRAKVPYTTVAARRPVVPPHPLCSHAHYVTSDDVISY